METKASAVPSLLHPEIAMLSRLSDASANFSRAMTGLRQRLFRKTPKGEPENAAQPCFVCSMAPVDGQRPPPPNDRKLPDSADFIRTQNQLVQAMLHSMILACGETIGRSAEHKDPNER